MNRLTICALGLLLSSAGQQLRASDHLDTRSVIQDPRADIGDIYAWMSPDRKRLNLAMTIVGHSFSPELEYAFHVDSGTAFGAATAKASIRCRVPSWSLIECKGANDFAIGNAARPEGIESRGGHFRLFAGVRDDPFFNNVRGSRDAYQAAIAAISTGVARDAAGCPQFSRQTSDDILSRWRHTADGPATNFLAGWTPASLVMSVDLDEIAQGGAFLAVWATVSSEQKQIDRMGRPLTGNAMLSPLAQDDVSDRLKEQYNESTPSSSDGFATEIEKTLALYDGFDGQCGNGWLAGRDPPGRYSRTARLLADDRIWINSRYSKCSIFMAVELAALEGDGPASTDCGGRDPVIDAIDVYRSLLARGEAKGIDDGVDRDERDHSVAEFPFLAAP